MGPCSKRGTIHTLGKDPLLPLAFVIFRPFSFALSTCSLRVSHRFTNCTLAPWYASRGDRPNLTPSRDPRAGSIHAPLPSGSPHRIEREFPLDPSTASEHKPRPEPVALSTPPRLIARTPHRRESHRCTSGAVDPPWPVSGS